ncbi:hypothetical protein BMI89_03085 [Thioclava sp. F36-7]|nr:hypothetical protein BMI89_03085 [Thioclava sp. F36-7]
MRKWDTRFIEIAQNISSWSEDPSRKVGAVIVNPSNAIISTGYNGFPRRIAHDPAILFAQESGEKYLWIEHAERNAIYNAANVGTATAGCTIYTTLFPCADCARAIIQSGLIRLVTYRQPDSEKRFYASMEASRKMLMEAGVKIDFTPFTHPSSAPQ